MTSLFRRVARVTVGEVQVEALRVQFRVVKTLRPEPNTAEVAISNLSPDTRRKMLTSNVPVRIEAGYENAGESTVQQLFLGDMRFGGHTREGADWVTKLQAGDGEKTFRAAKINESFAKGVRKAKVLEAAAKAMKVDFKAAVSKFKSAGFKAGMDEFAKGLSLDGSAAKELTKLLEPAGYTWSIQDGELQVLAEKETVGDAIVLSPDTGLVGSPEADNSDGYVKVRSLLHPELRPGRRVSLESESFRGAYRIDRAEFRGDTHGADWYSELELVPL